jgi:hypothetical protein
MKAGAPMLLRARKIPEKEPGKVLNILDLANKKHTQMGYSIGYSGYNEPCMGI